jgi:hypothetical protein
VLLPEADASGSWARQIGPIRVGQFLGGGLKFGLKYGIICAVLICQDKYSMINSKEERLGK